MSVVRSFLKYGFYAGGTIFSALAYNYWVSAPNNPFEIFKKDVDPITPHEVDNFLEASYHVHSLSLKAVDTIVKSEELMDKFNIPKELRRAMRVSWEENQPDILTRMEFYSEGDQLKFIGYSEQENGLLFLVNIAIGSMLEFTKMKQFNFLEKTVKKVFSELHREYGDDIYFANLDWNEEGKEEFIQDFFSSGEKKVNVVDLDILQYDEIGKSLTFESANGKKVVPYLYKIELLKLLKTKAIYDYLTKSSEYKTVVNEPLWKLILFSQAFLPYLHNENPEDPHIAPAFFVEPKNKEENIKFLKSSDKRWGSNTISFEESSKDSNYNSQDFVNTELFYDAVEKTSNSQKNKKIIKWDSSEKKNNSRILSCVMSYGIPISLINRTINSKSTVIINGESIKPNLIDSMRMSFLLRQRIYGQKGEDMKKSLEVWIDESNFSKK